MAEGGSSVDSGEVKLCDVCKEGGNEVNATNFCLQCEQYLCVDCKNYHSRVKATRSHELTGTDNIPSVSSATSTSESTATLICKEHERKLEFFCKTHKVELCLACRRIEHKECSTVVGITAAAEEIFSNNHGTKILKSLKDLTNGFTDCKAAAETIKDKLPGKKAKAVDSVKQARKIADQYLDKIETEAYHELDTIYEEETASLEEKIHICAASESCLQKRVNSLERIISIGEKEKEFIEINNATKDTKQYYTVLHELYQETFEKELTFQQNSNITRLNEWLNDLGKCCKDKSSVATSFHGPIAIYNREMKVKTEADLNEPAISSFTELPDGRKLIVDWRNKKVKMFDEQNSFMSEIVLADGMPWSLVLLSGTEAVVSSMSDTLHYLTISNVLKWTETKQVHLQIFFFKGYDKERSCKRISGMDKFGIGYNAPIMAMLESNSHEVFLATLDRNGNRQRTVCNYKEENLSKPLFVAVSEDKKLVFVLHSNKGCMGYRIEDGEAVLQYQNAKVKQYLGLAVGNSCVYIGTETGKRQGAQTQRLKLSGELETLNFSSSRPMKVAGNEIALFTLENNGERVINFCSLLR